MAKAKNRTKKKNPVQSVLFHTLAVLVTLIAAEAIGMLAVSPFMENQKASIVFAGILVLPLWATMLTLVYTADKRGRALIILFSASVISTIILFS
ncbi:MAG: hypothetical protein ACSHX6_13305 [Akkermansiaceae bacterium]